MEQIFKALVVFLVMTTAGYANPFQGVVRFNYDYELDGKLDARRFYKIEFSGDDTHLTGHYVDMDNDSHWNVRFYTSRESTIMEAVQIDGSFYRVMSGEIVDNKIRGAWFAVGGLKGDFEIIKDK